MTKDTKLRSHILDELDFDPFVVSAHIGVAVDDGIVTLTGHAASLTEKTAAEAAVRRVRGVRGIAADLTVVLPETHRRDDEELARQALCMVEWDMTIPKDAIQVSVENGWVTLSGTVDSYFAGRSAQQAVEKMLGVVGVTNLVNRRPHVMPQDVADRIRRVFERRDISDPHAIHVTGFGGKVTLEGNVRSLRERKLAERAALGTEGVTYVENVLVVDAQSVEKSTAAEAGLVT